MSSARELSVAEQDRLVAALADPAAHRDGDARASVIETHISYVLLTGRHAYKIKKALALGFLDFSTLDARRRFCEDEQRLNRRLAPQLYLGVVPVTGSVDAPRFGGEGPVIEYAVKMREFSQDALLSRLLARGEVGARDIDRLAEIVAAFHARADAAPPDGAFGAPDRVLHYALENFAQLAALPAADADRRELEALDAWTRSEFAAREAAMAARRRDGFVRECHGDLHLANLARVDGDIVPFDCLEFNAELRWIDTASEVAFVAMDLDDRGRPDFAHRFRSAYLEASGDYDALAVWRFYYVYRALVRAKVAGLRDRQAGARSHHALETELRGYVDLAARTATAGRGAIVVTHGLSGSGKSTVALALVEAIGAIRIRTDVERKRMHGLDAGARSRSAPGAGLYTDEATRAVYERVARFASGVARAGMTAIVDGAFLERWQRDRFRALAGDLGVSFSIVAVSAPEAALRERVGVRLDGGADASEADLAILERQQRTAQPLAPDERALAIECDGALAWDRRRAEALARELGRRA